MKNSALKRIIAVVLCLVVFAGSELTGLTNIVGDLFASENPEIEMEVADSAEPAEETEEIVLSAEESETEEEPAADVSEPGEESAMDVSEAEEKTPEDEAQPTEPEEITAEETQDDVEEAPADTEGEDGTDPVADTEEESEKQDGEDSQDKATDSQETETSAEIAEGKEGEAPNDGEIGAEEEALENTADGEETEVLDEVENADENEDDGEEEPEAFDEEYKDGQVIIRVEAEPGVVPNGTELSVKKIVQRDVEALDDEEEIKEAEELNAKYEDIQAELELSVADDDTKEIAAFVAYDVNFLLVDEDGETTEIEPDGEVSVSMEFEEAYLPEEIAEKAEQIDIESIDVIHMEEAGEDEESETGLKSEVVADADVSTTENAVEKAEFTTGSGKTFVITWTENDLGEREYVCETEDATIKVTAAKGVVPDGALLKVVPILADNEVTQKQYQDVEKKLLEKAESEEYEIAGFLAYDISFTDEAGVKLEPNGEVKVAIDYKKAAIPEDLKDLNSTTYALDDTEDDAEQAESAVSGTDVTETAPEKEVEETSLPESGEEETSESSNSQTMTTASTGNITVMHLEENDQGQVTKVVDMGAEGKVTALNSTLDQKITSTEFVTESFSTFTIVWTWKNDNGVTSKSVNVNFYLYAGSTSMGGEKLNLKLDDALKEVDLGESGTFNISDIYNAKNGRDVFCQLEDEKGVSYVFAGAYLCLGEYASYKLIRFGFDEDSKGFYWVYEGYQGVEERIPFEYISPESADLRFYYARGKKLDTVETVNNSAVGVTMRMIDYDGREPQDNLFDGDRYDNGINIKYGIVEKRLGEDGYPVASKNQKSLKLLFGGETEEEKGVKSKEATGLFLKDIYDTTGYLQYSSFENYAYFNEEEGEFTVYTGIGSPKIEIPEPSQTDVISDQRGNFIPYDQIKEGVFSDNRNLYDEYGNPLSEKAERWGEQLYVPESVKYATEWNTCFGMYMEAVFVQPEGGKVSDGEDMIFKFNGDDDLWLFIDDTLILDIGGSHAARTGSINFATGIVTIVENGNRETTIKQLFEDSEFLPDGKGWSEGKPDDYFKGNTFADNTTHRLKMFYMEHGGGASDLSIRMNLSTIEVPERAVEVKKELSNTDKEKYKDVEFAFQAFVENETGGYEQLTDPVAIDEDGASIRYEPSVELDGETYQNVFFLKPGQTARFNNIREDRKYYVKELGVESEKYDKVTILGGPTIEEKFTDGSSSISQGIQSSATTVATRPRITFTNQCSDANSRKLRITKAKQGNVPENATFTFQVFFGDGKEAYKGPYILEKVDESETEVLFSDGKIEGISVGDTIIIDKIMSDTQYMVKEVDLDSTIYATPIITGKNVKEGHADQSISNGSNEEYAFAGNISLGYDAEITVTNRTGEILPLFSWEIVKKSSTKAESGGVSQQSSLAGAEFELVKVDQNNNGVTAAKEGMTYYGKSLEDDPETSVDEKGIIKWYQKKVPDFSDEVEVIPAGRYLLTEKVAPTGYSLSAENWIVDVKDDGSAEITVKDGTNVSYNGTDKRTFYFENDPLYELPSTGGVGIYWYMISGTLLMMAGILILYKRKYAGRC